MDVVASLRTDRSPAALYDIVSDLGTYGEWLEIVSKAVPVASDSGDPGPAWSVDLRGQLGPLRRSKRLRMVRTAAEPSTHARFERRELDGRQHSAWVMDATLSAATDDADTVLTVSLHYGGSLWVPMLDRVLRDEIERSRGRLVDLVDLVGP